MSSSVGRICHSSLVTSILIALGTVFQLSPQDVVATAGDDVRLDCLSPDSNPTAIISWTRDFDQLSSERFSVLSNGSLLISSVATGDQALYHCVATNDLLGTSVTSQGAEVTVLSELLLQIKYFLLRSTCM